MEHKDIDAIKALLVVLTAADVAEFEGLGLKFRFHRASPPLTNPSAMKVVPKTPVDQQLAEIRPDYAQLFPQGFPKHAPPKDTPPKAE